MEGAQPQYCIVPAGRIYKLRALLHHQIEVSPWFAIGVATWLPGTGAIWVFVRSILGAPWERFGGILESYWDLVGVLSRYEFVTFTGSGTPGDGGAIP